MTVTFRVNNQFIVEAKYFIIIKMIVKFRLYDPFIEEVKYLLYIKIPYVIANYIIYTRKVDHVMI